MSNSVTVIIVTYNSRDVVGDALRSIPDGVKIIVVDNGSEDGTCDYLRQHYPRVSIIANGKNAGFGVANNLGLAQATTEFSLLMNPDVMLFPETISGLVNAAYCYPDAAILSPRVVDEKDKEQLTLRPSILSRQSRSKGFSMDFLEGDVCAEVLSGAVILVRMSAFKDQPYFFDPNIFLYYEDDEICMRVRAQGNSCILVSSAKVIHIMGQSCSERSASLWDSRQMHRLFSRLYLLDKYGLGGWGHYIAMFFKLIFRLLLNIVSFDLEKLRVTLGRLLGLIRYLFRCPH